MQWNYETEKFCLTLSETLRSQSLRHNQNLHKRIKSFLKESESFLYKNLHFQGPLVEMSVKFCGKKEIQRLNFSYRSKNKPTDVLSFPIYDNLRKEIRSLPQTPIELGDIVICLDVAKKQAKEFNISLEQELIQLLLHGFLHLCGFDHEINSKEEKIMFDLEEKLMEKLWKKH